MSQHRTETTPTPIRIGIDVGGTFTDAVAVDAATGDLIGQSKVPTSHDHGDGVAHGIIESLHLLLDQVGRTAEDVVFLAHGTTQATNALLEGDVAPVGLIGIGSGVPALFLRRLAALSRIELTPGTRLPLQYRALKDPRDTAAVERILDDFAAADIDTVVVTEPFSVDDSRGERTVGAIARERGFFVTAAHEITSLYGLSKRTRTAVLNAVVLPRMFATADLVQSSIEKAGITAPLMVMRCDGGVMSLEEMRRRPLLTVLSGPAAGVAGALMQERLGEGVFLETGGTSTDVSVVRRGKVATQYTRFGGSTTYLSALDVRTVGIGGGSMVRVPDDRPGRVLVGPRSAHIAGLRYACYASADELAGAVLATCAPRDGDPADHVVLDAAGGRFALTLTCAANALSVVPAGAYAAADPESARSAMEPLAAHLGTSVQATARRVLEAAVEPVESLVAQLVEEYDLEPDAVRLVGGGGGAATVTPFLGETSGRSWSLAEHAEVISPIGVALALLREQVERIIPGATDEQILAVRREAEQALLDQGAAPGRISVDVTVDPQSNAVRAIASGATELRTQQARTRLERTELDPVAAQSLATDPSRLRLLAETPHHVVYGADRKRRLGRPRHAVRVVDRTGVVRIASGDAHVVHGTVADGATLLAGEVTRLTSYGDGGARAPAVQLLVGPTISDLSGVLDETALVSLARAELEGKARDEDLVAVLEVRR